MKLATAQRQIAQYTFLRLFLPNTALARVFNINGNFFIPNNPNHSQSNLKGTNLWIQHTTLISTIYSILSINSKLLYRLSLTDCYHILTSDLVLTIFS